MRGVTGGMMRLHALQPHRLHHQVVDQLRAAIIRGQIRPGERLLELTLAEQLGVSRGPVREALRVLEQEGLVTSAPHRGSFVASLAEEEIETTYQARALIEGRAIRRVLTLAATADIDELAARVDRMRAAAAAGRLDLLADEDVAFHQQVMALSGYQHLQRVWRGMAGLVHARTYLILRESPMPTIMAYTAESHQPIIDGLRTGDPEVAETSIRRHILETRRLIEDEIGSDGAAPA